MARRYTEIAVSCTKRHELQIHARWLSDNTVVEIRKINREHVIKRPCTRITAAVRALESRSFVSIEIRVVAIRSAWLLIKAVRNR